MRATRRAVFESHFGLKLCEGGRAQVILTGWVDVSWGGRASLPSHRWGEVEAAHTLPVDLGRVEPGSSAAV